MKFLSIIGAVLSLGCLCQATKLPKPTGPYNAGVRRFVQPFYMNHTGYEHMWLMNETREYMVTVYYPTLDESKPRPYLQPGFINVMNRDICLPPGNLESMWGHRVWNASYLPGKEPTGPTVFFDSRIRFPPSDGNSILLSELASHGYTVAAIDHPYEQLYLQFPNGTEVENPLGQTEESRPSSRIHDGYFETALRRGNVTIDLLDRWPQIVERMGGPFAKDNIGLLGLEMGASSMVDVANHTRVGAVCALALQQPFGHMSLREGFHWLSDILDDDFFKLRKGLEYWNLDRKVPALHLGGARDNSRFYWMKELFPKAWRRWLVIEDAEQLDFSDWTIWKTWGHMHITNWRVQSNPHEFQRANAVGKIRGERMVHVTNHIVRAFFDRHLRKNAPYDPIFEEEMEEWPEVRIMQGSHQTKWLDHVGNPGDRFTYKEDHID